MMQENTQLTAKRDHVWVQHVVGLNIQHSILVSGRLEQSESVYHPFFFHYSMGYVYGLNYNQIGVYMAITGVQICMNVGRFLAPLQARVSWPKGKGGHRSTFKLFFDKHNVRLGAEAGSESMRRTIQSPQIRRSPRSREHSRQECSPHQSAPESNCFVILVALAYSRPHST